MKASSWEAQKFGGVYQTGNGVETKHFAKVNFQFAGVC